MATKEKTIKEVKKVMTLKFYGLEGLDLHTKLMIQAASERTTLQNLVIKACNLYLNQVKLKKKQNKLL